MHWSVLLAIPVALYYVESWLHALLAAASYIGLMVVHELGHAGGARSRGLHVLGIEVYVGFGHCIFEAPEHELDDVIVAWGGVAAQTVVLLVAVAALLMFRALNVPEPEILYPVFVVLITLNMVFIITNLVPVEPLDGATAWRIFRLWRKKEPNYTVRKPARPEKADARNVVDIAVRRAQAASRRKK